MSGMKAQCCDTMSEAIMHRCDQHPGPFDCPDRLVYYSLQFDEYGLIIHDGGESYQVISYCPGCGTKLPESKRELWFETLEALGYDAPFAQAIPREYQTDQWYKKQ